MANTANHKLSDPCITTPFDRISLSLSGAGYRAAAFHLGSMAYLEKLQYQGQPLLQRVKVLSSVSGGSFVNAMYTTTVLNRGGFQHCFERLYQLMEQVDMIDAGLSLLGERCWPSFKQKKLVNALAEVYHDHFFSDRFEIYWRDIPWHLDEVIFNTADLANRAIFRFQKTSHDEGHFGNHHHPIPLAAAKEIRIADIVAASSCFPGGFEPLVFPQDFRHAASPNLDQWAETLRSKRPGNPHTQLMDGSIHGEGIGSALHAEQRWRKYHGKTGGQNPGLLIVSDVAPPGRGTGGANVMGNERAKSLKTKFACFNRVARSFSRSFKRLTLRHEEFYAPIFSNRVYELAKDNLSRRQLPVDILSAHDDLFEPSQRMEKVSNHAASVEVTLWFTPHETSGKENKLASLVACGNFNMCYHLLNYTGKLYHEMKDTLGAGHKKTNELRTLYSQLKEDWSRFKKDPFWLFVT